MAIRSTAISIAMPSPLLPNELERSISEAYSRYSRRHRSAPPDLVLDFRGVEYVEVTALSCAVAVAAERHAKKLRTRFRLPDSRAVRDILRVWRFFEAVSSAIGEPVESLIEDDLPLFREDITTVSGHPTGLAALNFNPAWRPGEPGHRSFFEFITFKLDGGVQGRELNASIPRGEAERWQGDLVRAVLAKHLPGKPGDENDISRVVIFESMANAVQHPGANLIQVASRFYLPTKAGATGNLAITIWDDGDSMISTLRSALEEGRRVRSTPFPASWYERVHVRKKTPSAKVLKPVREVMDQGEDPSRGDPDEIILLSCLSPGVTRTLGAPVPVVDHLKAKPQAAPEDTGLHPRPEPSVVGGFAGMGLFTLVRTVVDRYHGQLGFRCGNLFMNFELATDQTRRPNRVHYRATFTEFPDAYPTFMGNLLTIRIPTLQ